jgi:phenylalanine-4-hydroxylase
MASKTGWRVRPVVGMIREADFLEGLANKVFCSTIYIRQPEEIDFSVAPDYIHEVFGHCLPLMAPGVSDISESIGKYSIGASEFQIK